MKTNLVRAALACAVLAFTMTAAMAATTPVPRVDVVVTRDPNGNSVIVTRDANGTTFEGTTDANGQITFKDLAPGKYVIIIKGDSLIRAMDRLAPPVPPKHDSGPSLGLSVGGLFGGGGSHHSDHQGAGPTQGSHGESGGAAFAGGVYVASGDINGDGVRDSAVQPGDGGGNAPMLTFTITVHPTEGSEQVANLSSMTPYCRETAGQGARLGFAVTNSGGSATGSVTIGIEKTFLGGNPSVEN